jgi:hypothetical protein
MKKLPNSSKIKSAREAQKKAPAYRLLPAIKYFFV